MSLVADVFDVLLKDNKTGQLFASTTLQSADINITVGSQDVTGGKNNALIAVLRSNRQVALTLAEIVFKWDWVANQLGKSPVVGAVENYATSKWYTATGTETVTIALDNEPLAADSGIEIYDIDGKKIESTNYTIEAKNVTFTTGISAGDKVEVRGYKYKTEATAETIEITNNTFPNGVTVVLKTIEINNDESPIADISYIFDNAIPSGNFTINTVKEKNPSAQNFEFRCIAPIGGNSIGRAVREPITA